MKINLRPDWLKTVPQTPLHERLRGKYYQHSVVCSGSRRKPVGEKGNSCCCLSLMKNLWNTNVSVKYGINICQKEWPSRQNLIPLWLWLSIVREISKRWKRSEEFWNSNQSGDWLRLESGWFVLIPRMEVGTSLFRHFGIDKPWRTVFAWKAKGTCKTRLRSVT